MFENAKSAKTIKKAIMFFIKIAEKVAVLMRTLVVFCLRKILGPGPEPGPGPRHLGPRSQGPPKGGDGDGGDNDDGGFCRILSDCGVCFR